jgi:hypothetical protein
MSKLLSKPILSNRLVQKEPVRSKLLDDYADDHARVFPNFRSISIISPINAAVAAQLLWPELSPLAVHSAAYRSASLKAAALPCIRIIDAAKSLALVESIPSPRAGQSISV